MDAVVAWLLDGDPAVVWQVRRDLLDADPAQVDAERARVATQGWGARLLAEQDPAGTWADGLYSPKWISTTYTLLLLRQLGLPADDARARRGCERLLDGAEYHDGGLTFAVTIHQPEVCITAMVVGIATAFGIVDDRVRSAMAWLLDQQLADGGWNCETVRTGSRHGSFNSSILVLEALQEWRQAGLEDARTRAAAQRGQEFFLAHRLYCSHRTGAVVRPQYTRMVFPPGWHHDLLRGLDYFAAAGAATDERLADAVALLRSRRRADGTWAGHAHHPGRYWFTLEPAGRPSRIATLQARRVLRWWDGGAWA